MDYVCICISPISGKLNFGAKFEIKARRGPNVAEIFRACESAFC